MDNLYHCEHERTELRERTFSNNTTHYVEQCLRCGTQLRSHKHDSNEVAQAKLDGGVKPFDDQLKHNFFAKGLTKRQEKIDEQHQYITDKQTEWNAWYAEYLRSPEWQSKRAKVLQRDNYCCQGCGGERLATEVHHLTYAHVGNELLFELVSLCGQCHERVHNERDATVRTTVPR